MQILEIARLEKLEKLVGKDTVVELINSFLEHTPARLEACRNGISSRNLAAVAKAAHSLKSSAGNLGALHLQELCEKLESSAESGNIDATVLMGDEFEVEYARAQMLFEKERTKWSN